VVQVDREGRGIPEIDILIQEIERNLWETWSTFGRGPACALHEEKDTLWLETPIPIVPYNGILRFHGQSQVDQRIAAFVEHFSQRKTQFMWIVHPSAQPTDLRDRLRRRGLMDIEPMFGMSMELAELPELPPLPENIEIRKVADETDVRAFYQFAEWRWNVSDEYKDYYAAIAAGFCLGKPGSRAHMWQAWRAGQPIAKAGMYQGSGSAGIYGVVTRPEARGLGLARALTLTALHEARSSGYGLAVLHSTPMAENLYKCIGFASIAEFRLFASEEVHV
jgi:ribosomal protein S18 acetylase RimI-like enzyme